MTEHSLIKACNDAIRAGYSRVLTGGGWVNLGKWRDHWMPDLLRFQIPHMFDLPGARLVSEWHYGPLFPESEGVMGRFIWELD